MMLCQPPKTPARWLAILLLLGLPSLAAARDNAARSDRASAAPPTGPQRPPLPDAALRAVLVEFEAALKRQDYGRAVQLLSAETLDYMDFVRTAAWFSDRGILEHTELGAAADILRLRGCLLGQYREGIDIDQMLAEFHLCGLLEARMQVTLIARFRLVDDAAQVVLSRTGMEQPIPLSLLRLVRERQTWKLDISRMHRTHAIEIRRAAATQGVPARPANGLYDFAHARIVLEWRRRGRTHLRELWTPLADRTP